MNIDVGWYNDAHTIVLYTFHRGWNWDDFNQATKDAAILLDAVTTKIHIIMDFRNASILPSGAVTQIQRAFRNQKHANAGITVVVGANSFIQAIVDMGRKLSKDAAKWEMEFVTTLDAALDLAKSQGPNPPITPSPDEPTSDSIAVPLDHNPNPPTADSTATSQSKSE